LTCFIAHTAAQGDEVVGSNGQGDSVEEYESYYLTKAKHLTVYENYLIIGDTYENGEYHYQRVRWNDIGDETIGYQEPEEVLKLDRQTKLLAWSLFRIFNIFKKCDSWIIFAVYSMHKPFPIM